jgi:hypothetical protein
MPAFDMPGCYTARPVKIARQQIEGVDCVVVEVQPM